MLFKICKRNMMQEITQLRKYILYHRKNALLALLHGYLNKGMSLAGYE